MNKSRKSPWAWMSFSIILIIVMVITGCDGSGIVSRPTLTPTPTASPVPKVTCMPDPGGFYMAPESSLGVETQTTAAIANKIYSDFQYARQIGASKAPEKSSALDLLAYETWRWSHIEYLKVDENNTLRLLMTFVSPELVRAAILNHAIYNSYPEPVGNLDDLTNKVLSKMDKNNELFFIIVVQPKTINQNTTSIEVLPENIILRNTSGLDVHKIKSDNLMPKDFNFSFPLQAGFIIFPAGTLADRGTCDQVLGTQRDTSITLKLNGIKIGINQPKDVDWDVPFAGALGLISAKPTPDPTFNLNDADYAPLNDITGLDIPGENGAGKKHADQYQFWLRYARFVWFKLTLDNIGQ